MNLSLRFGNGSINGLIIGNPEGYQTPHTIKVGAESLSKTGKDVLNKTANEATGRATKALGDLLNKKKE